MFSWHFSRWGSLLSILITGGSILPGSYGLAQIAPNVSLDNGSNIQTENDLSVIGGSTLMSNNLLHSFSESVPTSSSAYFNNPSSQQGASALVNDAGNITINTGNLIIRDSATVSVNTTGVIHSGSDNTSINPTNVNSTGSGGSISVNGGSISISVSNISISAKPVPEPTLTFSAFISAAFYAAWKLKRKQKQTHELKA
ncbi:hypothetical protein [Nostoc sp. UIC 10630]|uniref:hypothetical protein n=1 Tax=Nostoc sp. UIC 10630 TaxID=2100146 RepID=UPI0013D4A312|nr:hypothetical protein [Nostoc sp. UIC 10630]NEU84164.1 hypothetical protein [Nostoc sp. UIC 10630]